MYPKINTLRRPVGRYIGLVYGSSLAGMMLLASRVATAQPALQNAISMEAAADARRLVQPSQDYTFKSGDFRLLLVPSVQGSYNDNVNLASSGAQDDFIFSPSLSMTATYPLTAYNLLNLNIGVGYNEYVRHSDLSNWLLQSGSGLSFDILIKDFTINLHDQANYSQDGSQNTTIAGTSQFGTLQNTVGLLGTWNLRDVVLSLGYDHVINESVNSSFQSQDNSSEELVSRAGYTFSQGLTAGVEVTGTFTTYDQQILNNNDSYSFGVYGDWQPGDYLHVRPRVGYSLFEFQQTSISNIHTGNLSSYYFDLSVTHQITKVVSYSFSAGRETRLGIQSDVVQDWYFRPSVSWSIIKDLGLSTSFNYEHGTQGAGNVSGNFSEKYDYYGTDLELHYPIMKRLDAGLAYRLTIRSSNANQSYTQDLVSLSLSYKFE